MQDMAPIQQFVRQVLGCDCPDAVFRHIDWRARVAPSAAAPYHCRLLVGRRLLVYLQQVDEVAQLQQRLALMLARGREERDRAGLNRFRAVIASVDAHRLRAVGEALWAGLPGTDARTHLHLVALPQAAPLLTPR
jgi:hypothetical protein